ncbi:rhamnan synthesis F family protein [Novosphingobium sp.]|uniref:rhamnan synthesis F family protein n=1 Tax=Novosphingobium sp. TaxID=1874826 RepID=UPI0025FB328F|nr:rhamnan synthesis F family protein [Novosphingobium sp.]
MRDATRYGPGHDASARHDFTLANPVIERAYRSLRRRLYKSGVAGGLPADRDFSLGVPFGFEPALSATPRVAAMIHMFHPELAAEFALLLHHLPDNAAVLISTDTQAKRRDILAAFGTWDKGAVEVRIVPNRGRDMAPKLTSFTDRYAEFDLVLFLHSKKTEFSTAGEGWRELLLGGLCGSDTVVRSILALFEADPALGLVFPQHHEPIRPFTGWEYNFAAARALGRRMGVELRRDGMIEFPSGSMFWARPAALAPILVLGLTADDFPEEAAQTDATTAHAIERLFALAAELAGFGWLKVAAPACYANRETIVIPRSAADLEAFIQRPRLRLRDTMVQQPRLR